jgi:hypothetical protein
MQDKTSTQAKIAAQIALDINPKKTKFLMIKHKSSIQRRPKS